MRVPAFRLVWLLPQLAPLRPHHREWLREKKIGFFPHFSRQELESLCDLLHLLTGWQTLDDGRFGDPERSEDFLEFVMEEGENLLLDLRQPLVAALGQLYPERQPVLSAGLYVADSPFTYINYVEGVWRRLAEAPDMPAERVTSAGLARCLEGMLAVADPLLAEWAVALALDPARAASWVSTQASILGKDLAIQRCLHAGLLLRIDGDHLDWRRPLEAIKEHSLPDLLLDLEHPSLRPILEAALGLSWRRSPLPPPRVPATLVGREELLGRLKNVVQATGRCSYTVLVGGPGMGKRSVAAALCSGLPDRDPLWLSLGGGIDAAFRRLADALEVPPDGVVGVGEGWASRLRRRLLRRPYLLVLEGEFFEGEEELLKWLPSGEGALAILVLSTKPLRLLEQRREAIQLRIRELDEGQSRQLLASIAGAEAMAEPDLGTLLPRLGGSPQFLEAAARTRTETGKWPTEVGNALVESWVRRQWEGLSEGARLVLGMAVCMQGYPFPLELVRQTLEEKEFSPTEEPKLDVLVADAVRVFRSLALQPAVDELLNAGLVLPDDDAIVVPSGLATSVIGEFARGRQGGVFFLLPRLIHKWMRDRSAYRRWQPAAVWLADIFIGFWEQYPDSWQRHDAAIQIVQTLMDRDGAPAGLLERYLDLPDIKKQRYRSEFATLCLAEVYHRDGAPDKAIHILRRMEKEPPRHWYHKSLLNSHLALMEYVESQTINDPATPNWDRISALLGEAESLVLDAHNQPGLPPIEVLRSHAAYTKLCVRMSEILREEDRWGEICEVLGDYIPPETVPAPTRAEFHRLLGLAQLHLAENPETEPEKPPPPRSELLEHAEENLNTALKLYPEEDYPEQARQILEGIGRTRRLRLSLPQNPPPPSPPPE